VAAHSHTAPVEIPVVSQSQLETDTC
jgi:hypothetical protein